MVAKTTSKETAYGCWIDLPHGQEICLTTTRNDDRCLAVGEHLEELRSLAIAIHCIDKQCKAIIASLSNKRRDLK